MKCLESHIFAGEQNRCCRRAGSSPAGFTLIELLAVIAIIMILAAMVLGLTVYAQSKALRERTRVDIKNIEGALERYRNEVGQYPTNQYTSATNYLYRELCTSGGDKTNAGVTKIFLEVKSDRVSPDGLSLLDPYGYRYGYQCPGSNNVSSFDLYSAGGTGDPAPADFVEASETNALTTKTLKWITNWREQ